MVCAGLAGAAQRRSACVRAGRLSRQLPLHQVRGVCVACVHVCFVCGCACIMFMCLSVHLHMGVQGVGPCARRHCQARLGHEMNSCLSRWLAGKSHCVHLLTHACMHGHHAHVRLVHVGPPQIWASKEATHTRPPRASKQPLLHCTGQ